MTVLVALELLARSIDYDNDQDGGKMGPVLQKYSTEELQLSTKSAHHNIFFRISLKKVGI